MATETKTELRTDKVELEIVTPKGRALSVQADEVTAPSVEGEFGVMPGHLPLLAALRTGIVSYRVGGDTKKVAIGPGFAEAGANKVAILTDEYIEREQIDPVLVRKELAEVQGKIAEAEKVAEQPAAEGNGDSGESHKAMLIARENWLAVQLELYGDPPAATMRPFETFGPPDGPDEADVPMPDDAESQAAQKKSA